MTTCQCGSSCEDEKHRATREKPTHTDPAFGSVWETNGFGVCGRGNFWAMGSVCGNTQKEKRKQRISKQNSCPAIRVQ
eukprot:5739683-Amphidinium_carterae.1